MSGVCLYVSEMNGANIRLRMTLKINVGCLSLAFGNEWHGNIRLRMTLKMKCRVFAFTFGNDYGNIRLGMTLK